MSALGRVDVKAIWAEVQENRRKRLSCAVHSFPHYGEHRFGQKVTCTRCGAWLSIGDAISYVEGFAAAGGDGEAVWPGYGAPRPAPAGSA